MKQDHLSHSKLSPWLLLIFFLLLVTTVSCEQISSIVMPADEESPSADATGSSIAAAPAIEEAAPPPAEAAPAIGEAAPPIDEAAPPLPVDPAPVATAVHGPAQPVDGLEPIDPADTVVIVTPDIIVVTHPLPPLLMPVSDQTVALGESLTLPITATDDNGDPITFSTDPLPLHPNMALSLLSMEFAPDFSSSTALGEFTFRPDAGQVGSFAITITAADGNGGVDSQSFTITVTGPPAGSQTSITGRLLDTNDFVQNIDTPVVGATISLLDTGFSTTSDSNGNFTLPNLTDDTFVLDIDAATADPAPDGSLYAGFREEINLIASVNNVISRPFFLPRIAMDSLTTVDPVATTTVENSTLGVSMSVPPQTAKSEDGSNFTEELSISEVPGAIAPAALPDELDPGLLITIQPVGVTFDTPVPITFPNTDNLAPGSVTDIWSLDAATGEFVVVGKGRVSGDGQTIATTSGGIRAADWHAVIPPALDGDLNQESDANACEIPSGSRTAVATGNLRITHNLPPYISQNLPTSSQLIYSSLSADPQPILSLQAEISAPAAVPKAVSASLIVGGIQQGSTLYTDTSTFDENQDEPFLQVFQVDASQFETGAYKASLELASHYNASSVSRSVPGALLVNNQSKSPFGAGWSLAGLQRLFVQTNGNVLITNGDGSTHYFTLGGPRTEVIEPGWSLVRTVNVAHSQSAVINPIDEQIYFGIQNTSAGQGLYRIDENGNIELLHIVANGVEGIAVDPSDGDLFYSRQINGGVTRVAFGDNGRQFWATTNGDDTFGIAIAPENYTGHVVVPGEGLVVKRITTRPGDIVKFSTEQAFVQEPVYEDVATLANVVDVTIGPNAIYVVETGENTEQYVPGHIYQLGAGAVLTEVVTSEPILNPVGIATDPLSQDLFVLDSGADRLVRIDPQTGALSDMITGLTVRDNAWAGVDVTPDGQNIIISDAGAESIYVYTRGTIFDSAGDYTTLVKKDDGTYDRIAIDGTTFHFDAAGLQTSVVDANGNETIYEYDTEGRLTTITDPVNLVTTFNYAGGLLSSIEDPANRTTFFEHAVGNLTRITDSDGTFRTFNYDFQHHLTLSRSKRGENTIYRYDSAGRHSQTELPDSSTRFITAQSTFGLINYTSGVGTEMNPASPARPINAVASYVDGESRITLIKTGQFGEATEITEPAGLSIQIERDRNGNPTQIIWPSGHVFNHVYDEFGNQVAVHDDIFNSDAGWTYEQPFNLLRTATDPQGEVTNYAYIGANLTSTTSPLGRESSFTYDSRGNITSNVNTFDVDTTWILNGSDNISEVHHGPLQNARVHLFDRNNTGFIEQITNPLDQIFGFAYDDLGRIISETLPSGSAIVYGYDDESNLDTLTPPGQPPHTFEYQSTNNLQLYRAPMVGPNVSEITYTYDLDGQLVGIEFPGGDQVDFDLDQFGRLAAVNLPGGAYTFGYDPQTGQLVSVTDPDGGSLAYEYNGELKTSTEWFGGEIIGTVHAGYDSSYRVNSLTVASLPAISYTYDADGQLASAGNLVISRSLNSGLATETTLGAVVERYSYNEFAEPDNFLAEHNGTILFESDYVYDALGRVSQVTETIDNATHVFDYTYDLDGRLESVTQDGLLIESFAYDANGNRTLQSSPTVSVSSTYDDQDRLLTHGSTSFTYTDKGDLLTKSAPGGSTTYNYDVLGDLRSVTLPDSTTIEYIVDGENRRVGKKVNGTLVQGFLYKDGLNPIAELDDNNQIVSLFIYGTRPNVPDYMVRDGLTYRILSDLRGSPRLIVDIATGDVVARRDYNSFGNVLQDTNPGFQPFGFAGGLYDPDTGLTRFGARDYDAQVGRWTAKDPTLFHGGQPNFYVYAYNDPLNFYDLNGLITDSISTTCLNPKGAALCAAIGFGVAKVVSNTTETVVRHCAENDISLPDIDISFSRVKSLLRELASPISAPSGLPMSRPGNHADTGIMEEVHALIASGAATSVCDALDIMFDEAKKAKDKAKMKRINTTRKIKKCRPSTTTRLRSHVV